MLGGIEKGIFQEVLGAIPSEISLHGITSEFGGFIEEFMVKTFSW